MDARFITTCLAATLAVTPFLNGASALQARPDSIGRIGRVPAGKGSLYVRDIGRGPPVIILHGGPDFDQAYLLPDFDRLADVFQSHLLRPAGAG